MSLDTFPKDKKKQEEFIALVQAWIQQAEPSGTKANVKFEGGTFACEVNNRNYSVSLTPAGPRTHFHGRTIHEAWGAYIELCISNHKLCGMTPRRMFFNLSKTSLNGPETYAFDMKQAMLGIRERAHRHGVTVIFDASGCQDSALDAYNAASELIGV